MFVYLCNRFLLFLTVCWLFFLFLFIYQLFICFYLFTSLLYPFRSRFHLFLHNCRLSLPVYQLFLLVSICFTNISIHFFVSKSFLLYSIRFSAYVNIIEITFRHGYFPVKLLHIFRKSFFSEHLWVAAYVCWKIFSVIPATCVMSKRIPSYVRQKNGSEHTLHLIN